MEETVPAYLLRATKSVLAERERELLELKGPCSSRACCLHYAHSGPCDILTNEELCGEYLSGVYCDRPRNHSASIRHRFV